jgi:hypothetical protein
MSAPNFDDIELDETSGPVPAPPSPVPATSQPEIPTAVPSSEVASPSPNHPVSWQQRQIRSNRDGWSDEFDAYLQEKQPSEDRDNLLQITQKSSISRWIAGSGHIYVF